MRQLIKKLVRFFGFDPIFVAERFGKLSLWLALREQGLSAMVPQLRGILPDVSNQEDEVIKGKRFNDYWELKRRGLQAFQCTLMLRALEKFPKSSLQVVDIGDSSGAHIAYLKELTKERFRLESMSVNIDPRAIEKITERGFRAVLCRAEEFDPGTIKIDLCISFEMLEHLIDPIHFLKTMVQKFQCKTFILTVPYLKQSRVGFYQVRKNTNEFAVEGEEHIFELSPQDWSLILQYAGWKIISSKVYYQYPRRIPLLSSILRWYWRTGDFEGFWGAVLEKHIP